MCSFLESIIQISSHYLFSCWTLDFISPLQTKTTHHKSVCRRFCTFSIDSPEAPIQSNTHWRKVILFPPLIENSHCLIVPCLLERHEQTHLDVNEWVNVCRAERMWILIVWVFYSAYSFGKWNWTCDTASCFVIIKKYGPKHELALMHIVKHILIQQGA